MIADGLRKLREQATRGPWEILEDPGSWTYDVHGADSPASVISMALDDKTAAFVAGAANLWPLLCDFLAEFEKACIVSGECLICGAEYQGDGYENGQAVEEHACALSVLADATQEPA